MKKLIAPLLIAALLMTGCTLFFPGCAAPTERVTEVKTLLVIGATVDATMKLSGQLYTTGQLSQERAQEISNFHANKFQPVYRLAVAAVQSDLTSYASPELIKLADELANMIEKYRKP